MGKNVERDQSKKWFKKQREDKGFHFTRSAFKGLTFSRDLLTETEVEESAPKVRPDGRILMKPPGLRALFEVTGSEEWGPEHEHRGVLAARKSLYNRHREELLLFIEENPGRIDDEKILSRFSQLVAKTEKAYQNVLTLEKLEKSMTNLLSSRLWRENSMLVVEDIKSMLNWLSRQMDTDPRHLPLAIKIIFLIFIGSVFSLTVPACGEISKELEAAGVASTENAEEMSDEPVVEPTKEEPKIARPPEAATAVSNPKSSDGVDGTEKTDEQTSELVTMAGWEEATREAGFTITDTPNFLPGYGTAYEINESGAIAVTRTSKGEFVSYRASLDEGIKETEALGLPTPDAIEVDQIQVGGEAYFITVTIDPTTNEKERLAGKRVSDSSNNAWRPWSELVAQQEQAATPVEDETEEAVTVESAPAESVTEEAATAQETVEAVDLTVEADPTNVTAQETAEVVVEDGTVEATETVIASVETLGQVQVNTETGKQEVWVGNGYVMPPLDEQYFDPANLVVREDKVSYESQGLTKVWSDEKQAWVFPEKFPYKVGEVVPVSIMGGKVEIANQEEAMRVSKEIVMSWLNHEVNQEFRSRVYGKDQLVWEDLETLVDGETRYLIKLTNMNGEEIWPDTIFISSTMQPGHSNLGQTFDNEEGVKFLDVSSPLWLIDGWQEWKNGTREFITKQTTGPNSLFGVSWSDNGLRFTHDGRVVLVGLTKEFFNSKYNQPNELGGKSGLELDPFLVRAYVASTLKAFQNVKMDDRSYSNTPFDKYPNYGTDVVLAGVTQEEMDASAYVDPSLFGLVAK